MKIHIPAVSFNTVIDSAKIPRHDLKQSADLLFRSYKKYISSQDIADCVFSPSCSEYALSAIKKQGFFAGFLNSLDRLTRCSNGNEKYYPLRTQDNLRIDHVRNIKYEEK